MPALQHLSAEARAVAELDDDRRLAHLAEDHWIDYPRARETLQVLERLLRCPERTRMPGLLLHGESNIGKSMIIEKFLRAHPARDSTPTRAYSKSTCSPWRCRQRPKSAASTGSF